MIKSKVRLLDICGKPEIARAPLDRFESDERRKNVGLTWKERSMAEREENREKMKRRKIFQAVIDMQIKNLLLPSFVTPTRPSTEVWVPVSRRTDRGRVPGGIVWSERKCPSRAWASSISHSSALGR
jgi:hypothetical protein